MIRPTLTAIVVPCAQKATAKAEYISRTSEAQRNKDRFERARCEAEHARTPRAGYWDRYWEIPPCNPVFYRDATDAEVLHAKTVLHNAEQRAARVALERRGGFGFKAWRETELCKYVDARCDTCAQWYQLADPPVHCPSLLEEAARHSAHPEQFARACQYQQEGDMGGPLFRTADGRIDHPAGQYRHPDTGRLVREFRPGGLDPKCGHAWGCPCDGTSELARQTRRELETAECKAEIAREASEIAREAAERGISVGQVERERYVARMGAAIISLEELRRKCEEFRRTHCAYCGATDGLEADDASSVSSICMYYCQECWAWWRA